MGPDIGKKYPKLLISLTEKCRSPERQSHRYFLPISGPMTKAGRP